MTKIKKICVYNIRLLYFKINWRMKTTYFIVLNIFRINTKFINADFNILYSIRFKIIYTYINFVSKYYDL